MKNIPVPGKHGRPIVTDVIYQETEDPKPVIVFVHGYKGFKDWGTFPMVAQRLSDAGFVVIKFNFSHNGGTLEQPIDFPDLEAYGNNTYSIEQDDLTSILDWIIATDRLPESEVNHGNISLIGHSRGGGAVLLCAARDSRVQNVVTWASVADFGERFDVSTLEDWKEKGVMYVKNGRTLQDMPHYFSFYEDFKANEANLTISTAVQSLNIPQLIVHGSNDEAVSEYDAERLQKWNPMAQKVIIDGAGHTFGGKHPWDEAKLPDHLEKVVNATIRFLNDSNG